MELESKFYVYKHILDNEVIYVGCGGKRRPHTYHSRNQLYYDIVGDRWKEVVIEIVQVFDCKVTALKFEEELTLYYKSLGQCRGNIKNANKGYQHTEESKEKLRRSGEENGMYGQTHTEEARAKISKARKGTKWLEEQHLKFQKHIHKNGANFKGCKHADKTKELMSAKHQSRQGCCVALPNGEQHYFTSRAKCAEFLNMNIVNVINIINKGEPYYTRYKKFKHLEGMTIVNTD